MKFSFLFLGIFCVAVSGCALFESESEPRVAEWKQSTADLETQVFGPMQYDEMKEFVLQKELQGWRTSSCEQAGAFLPGAYLIVMQRPTH